MGTETAIHNPQFRRGSGAVRFSKIAVEDSTGRQRFEFEMPHARRDLA